MEGPDFSTISDSGVRLGVDLGGTKIEAVVVRCGGKGDMEVREELARIRRPTERDRGYDHVVAITAAIIRDVAEEAKLARLPSIGVGMPGSVTRDGVVKNSNTVCLNGRPFRSDLMATVGFPIAFANDANCFALAEAHLGAARGARVVFGMILGTGVGGGLVVDGKVWDGAQGIAGEWGHVTLEPERGPACYCGRRGCVEQYLSGPAIEASYAAKSGEKRPLVEIVARRHDDAYARETLRETIVVFGRALATVINVVDPDVVVLGGGVSNVDLLYTEGIASVARWVFSDSLQTRIVRHGVGDSAGVLGAALLGN
jgi:fructokinase